MSGFFQTVQKRLKQKKFKKSSQDESILKGNYLLLIMSLCPSKKGQSFAYK